MANSVLVMRDNQTMTLLLTCVTPRFVVQASDRRLTYLNGDSAEEIGNKATMLCRQSTFAFTGLARCSLTERTDELLLRCLAKTGAAFDPILNELAKEAGTSIRNLPLQVRPSDRGTVRRTSFVGAGFLGIRNPGQFGRRQAPDELHPFVAVVSNAQKLLSEEWRPQADRDFSVSRVFLDENSPFILHAAGQPFIGSERMSLERCLRKNLDRIDHPESLARLLTRSVRFVSARNRMVGPNVMCTIVRRDKARTPATVFRGGMAPLTPEVRSEANYFKWPSGGSDDDFTQFIFSPGDPDAVYYYGPNYTCNELRVSGMLFGPSPIPADLLPPRPRN